MLRYLVFPSFMFCAVLSAITGTSVLGILLTLLSLGLMVYFKNQIPNKLNADEVLQPHKCSIIAHRGGGHDAPENTIAAIREAHSNGADGIEFDLEFSSDGVPILMHDDTLDRTTDGTGPINKKTHSEVLKLNASAKHHLKEQFPEEKVPTLEETVEECLKLGLKMYIDVKGSTDRSVEALVSMFQKYPEMYKHAIVCSFWPQIPYKVRKQEPKIVTACTHRNMNFSRYFWDFHKDLGKVFSWPVYVKLIFADLFFKWGQFDWLWYFVGCSAMILSLEDSCFQTVEYFKKRGIQVVVWTPNAKHDKEYVTKTLGCSYITDTLKS